MQRRRIIDHEQAASHIGLGHDSVTGLEAPPFADPGDPVKVLRGEVGEDFLKHPN